jgi:dihydrofolate reductase
MRELILKMSITIDGFVAGPNGEMDWLFENRDDAGTAWTVSTLWEAGVHITGSRTFHDMAAYWPGLFRTFCGSNE